MFSLRFGNAGDRARQRQQFLGQYLAAHGVADIGSLSEYAEEVVYRFDCLYHADIIHDPPPLLDNQLGLGYRLLGVPNIDANREGTR